jgi:exodeoxyribonuclease V gamma subunit
MHPCRAFLQRRLGIFFHDKEAPAPLSEPFGLEGLEEYTLKEDIVGRMLCGTFNEQALLQEFYGRNVLPHGNPGKILYADLVQECLDFAGRLRSHIPDGCLRRETIEFETGGFRIAGNIGNISANNVLLRISPSGFSPKTLLGLWVDLLISAAFSRGRKDISAVFISAKEAQPLLLIPPADAQSELGRLLDYYWRGLRLPLPFFPKSSYGFAENLKMKNGDPGTAMKAALLAWRDREFPKRMQGEGNDCNIIKCFGNTELTEIAGFTRTAVGIFEPLLQCCRRG